MRLGREYPNNLKYGSFHNFHSRACMRDKVETATLILSFQNTHVRVHTKTKLQKFYPLTFFFYFLIQKF